MKKLLFAVIAALTLVSCSDTQNEIDDPSLDTQIKIDDPSLDTLPLGKWVSEGTCEGTCEETHELYSIDKDEVYSAYTADTGDTEVKGVWYKKSYVLNNIAHVPLKGGTGGYIYGTYTQSLDPDTWEYTETAPDVGKWYSILYTVTGDSMNISGADGGKTSCDSLDEAKKEFVIENNYFNDGSTVDIVRTITTGNKFIRVE